MKFAKDSINDTTQRTADRIVNDLGPLLDEGRALLSDVLAPHRKKIRRASDTLEDLGTQLSDYRTRAARAARKGARYARYADDYVKENPWPAIAGGLALGILATLWFTRR